MINLPDVVTLPMQMDESGVIRISGTRVTFDSLIGFYLQGEMPEALHEGFPTVPLAVIYAVISYYLAHRPEMDAYLKERSDAADTIRQEWESRHPPPSKAELLGRLKKKKQGE